MRISVRLCCLLACATAAGCSSMSPEEYNAQIDRLEAMDCLTLEDQLLLTESRKEIRIIRQIQSEKGCEIRPLLAGNQKKKKRPSEPFYRKSSAAEERRRMGLDRAVKPN